MIAGIRMACRAAIVAILAAMPAAGQAVAGDPLRPGDVVRIRVASVPEMSGDYPVDERGAVTLPKVGVVEISAWPSDSIRPRLTVRFAEYLRDPAIEVVLARRISVTGSVMKPSLYLVDPTMSVSDALALAGGPAPDGQRDKVELRRGGQRMQADLGSDTRIGDLRLRSGDQLFVPQKSWLSRNTWFISTLIGAAATVTTIIVTR